MRSTASRRHVPSRPTSTGARCGRLVARALAFWLAGTTAVLGLAALTAAAPTEVGAAVSASTPVQYDLAMGDSVAAGVGASTSANDYVNLVYQHELATHPGLQLENLACSGATTGSVINGPGCSYTTGTQLGDTEAFLRAHPGQVKMLTIDIGGNDVDGCLGSSGIVMSCVQNGLSQISTNLPVILNGLRAADPTLAIYGMDYYDPFLDQWLTGTSGQAVAEQSETLVVDLNAELGQLYAAGKAAMADPATLFQTTDFALTGSYQGETLPQNVADICNWTLMCSQNNIHPDDQGHAEIAQAFETVVDQPPTTSVLLPAAGSTVSGTSVVLDASATDPGLVGSVQFEIDSGAYHGATIVGTAVPTLYGYIDVWNSTTVGNGTYTLTSLATDTAGNTGTSAPVSVTVDNAPPTTAVLIPSANATVGGGAVTLDASASDPGGIGRVQFLLTGETNGQTRVIATAVPTLYGYIAQWNATVVPNGVYTLQSTATDIGGNLGESPGVLITVDNPPPSTSVLVPSAGATVSGSSVTLDASASDPGGVAIVQFVITGGSYDHTVVARGLPTLYGYVAVVNSNAVPDGTYTLQSTAQDTGGNTATSAGVQVTVDN